MALSATFSPLCRRLSRGFDGVMGARTDLFQERRGASNSLLLSPLSHFTNRGSQKRRWEQWSTSTRGGDRRHANARGVLLARG
jgi:hypothetical protein